MTALGATVYVLSISRIFSVDNPDDLGYLLVPGGLAAGALASLGHVRPRGARLLVAALALSALPVAPAPWSRARDTDRVPRVVAEADPSIRIAGATRTLGNLADATAWGAPHAANVLAAIGWHRGEALWRLGHPDLALDALNRAADLGRGEAIR